MILLTLCPILISVLNMQYLNKQTYDTFYLFRTSTSEIETEISAINVRKATGTYSIPLAQVETWLNTNKLSLNISKSNFVLFHPPQKKVNDAIKLYVNNTLLEEKNHVKYLGIMMDSNLNWKSHATNIAKKT